MESADSPPDGPLSLTERWRRLQGRLEARFGRQVGVEAALFLIGMHARGLGYDPLLPKEAKQDLIMEGGYHALSMLGLYERVEEEGGMTWRKVGVLPAIDTEEQEQLLKRGILTYFDDVFAEA